MFGWYVSELIYYNNYEQTPNILWSCNYIELAMSVPNVKDGYFAKKIGNKHVIAIGLDLVPLLLRQNKKVNKIKLYQS